MQPKVQLNQVRKVEEIINHSVIFFKQNWKPLLKSYYVICGFFLAAVIITFTFNQLRSSTYVRDFPFVDNGVLLTIFLEMMNYIFITLTSLSFISLYKTKNNEAPNVEEVWSYVKFYFLRMFGSTVILGVVLLLGLLFCVIPGIYLWPILTFIPVIMILDNTSLAYGFNHAFRLLKSYWGEAFAVLAASYLLVIAASILLIIPIMIVASIVIFLIGNNEADVYFIALNIALHFVQFLAIFPFITFSLLFYSLTEQAENSTLMQRIQQIGVEIKPLNEPYTEEDY